MSEATIVVALLTQQAKTLEDIHEQTMKTNGRVTALELREAEREAVRLDRAERLKSERITRADKLKVVDAKRSRKVGIFAGLCGLSSGIATSLFLLASTGHL